MLKRLYVDNVRCLTNFEFAPGKVAVLVGPNGGGKSSVYMVLGALQAFLGGSLLAGEVFGPGSLTKWERRRTQRIELDAEGTDKNTFAYSLQVRHPDDGKPPLVEEEQLSVNGNRVYRLADGEVQLFGDGTSSKPSSSFPFAPTRSFLPLLEQRPDNALIMSFRRWVSGIWLFSLQPQNIDAVSKSEGRALDRDGKSFVSWYRMLAQEKPGVREALRADLGPIVPGLSEIRLVTIGQAAKYLSLDCELSGTRFSLEFNELSEGQRALMVLYAIKHAVTGDASVLFFDEPDNYLAQREIQPWLAALRESFDPLKATLLVISHHPEVIDYLAPDQVLRLWRTDDGPTRIEAVEFDRSNGLTASEALQMETP